MSQYITIQLNGTLGQQLYQYAAGRALSSTLGGRLTLLKEEGIDYRPVLFQSSTSVAKASTVYLQKTASEPWTPERFRGIDVLYCKGEFQYLPALEGVLPFLKQELIGSLYSIRQQLTTKYNLQMRKRAAFVYITKNKPQDYYESAIATLSAKKSIHVYILSDDPSWTKEQPWLRGYTLIDEPEMHALAFMSLCEGGSVGDTPLGWWGSFLSV
jgi:hypothetical protein